MTTATEAKGARQALQKSGTVGYHGWALTARLASMEDRRADEGAIAETRDRPFYRARIHARLMEIDEALKCLEQSYQEHECLLVTMKTLEWWDPLRSDPRFTDLMQSVGIPQTIRG